MRFYEVIENGRIIGRMGVDELSSEFMKRYPEEMSNIKLIHSVDEFSVFCNEEDIELLEDYTTKMWCREIMSRIDIDDNYLFEGSINLYEFEAESNTTMIRLAIDMLESKVEVDEGYATGYYDDFVYKFLETDEGLVCSLYIGENLDDAEYSQTRYFNFNVFGSEMLPLNHFVLGDFVLEFIADLAKVVNRKYTFHKEGIPCLFVDKDGIKKVCLAS